MPRRSAAVEVQEAGTGPTEVARQRRQQADRARGVATHRLALHPLADPQQRRPGRVAVRGLLDQPGRHACRPLAPRGRACRQRRLELLEAKGVLGQEPAVGQPVADDHVAQREGQGRVGARERLQVQVGAPRRRRGDRVDHHEAAGGARQPVLVGVGRRGRRVGPPHEHAAGVVDRARVEADLRRAVEQVQRDVAGEVADRVGVDLGGAQPVEEALAEPEAEDAEGP